MSAFARPPGWLAAAGESDPHWANVIALLGFNEANGATTFIDDSPAANNFSQAGTGGSAISTATPRFGTGALANGGNTARARAASAAAFNMSGATAFTVEFFARYAALPSVARGMMAFNTNNSGFNAFQWAFLVTPSNLIEFRTNGTAGVVGANGTLPTALNTWHHFAGQRLANGRVLLWINGQYVGASSAAGSPPSSTVLTAPTVAEMAIGHAQGWNGETTPSIAAQFDEVRITKGVARYTEGVDFAVPTAPYPRG